METIKTNNEALNEGAKLIEKLFNNTNSIITDIYKKQIDLTTDYYSNLLNNGFNNTNRSSLSNIFINEDGLKWFSNPFLAFLGNNFQSTLFSPIERTMKQMSEFNQNLLSAFTGAINGKGTNQDSINEEYKETIEIRLEAAKEISNTIYRSYIKQLESSIEINKAAIEEINNQLNRAMNQNQKFWGDILKTYQTSVNTGDEKKTETPINAKVKPVAA